MATQLQDSKQTNKPAPKPIQPAPMAADMQSFQEPLGAMLQRAQLAPDSITPYDAGRIQRFIGNHAFAQLMGEEAAATEETTTTDEKAVPVSASDSLQAIVGRTAVLTQKSTTPQPGSQTAVRSKHQTIQRQLQVGEEDSPLEEEANEVAEDAVKKPLSASAPPPADDADEDETTPTIQRKADTLGGGTVTPDVESRITNLQGRGSPLPDDKRSLLEDRIGADFSNIRVHTGSNAAQLSQDLNARAFTVGKDIAFNDGQYNPNTTDGQKLLAHELTHTVQQGAAGQLQTDATVQAKQSEKSTGEPMVQAWLWDDDKEDKKETLAEKINAILDYSEVKFEDSQTADIKNLLEGASASEKQTLRKNEALRQRLFDSLSGKYFLKVLRYLDTPFSERMRVAAKVVDSEIIVSMATSATATQMKTVLTNDALIKKLAQKLGKPDMLDMLVRSKAALKYKVDAVLKLWPQDTDSILSVTTNPHVLPEALVLLRDKKYLRRLARQIKRNDFLTMLGGIQGIPEEMKQEALKVAYGDQHAQDTVSALSNLNLKAEKVASKVYQAIDWPGTAWEELTEALEHKSRQEMDLIKAAYLLNHGNDMEKDLRGDMEGPAQHQWATCTLAGDNIGQDVWRIKQMSDEEGVLRLLRRRNKKQRKQIAKRYAQEPDGGILFDVFKIFVEVETGVQIPDPKEPLAKRFDEQEGEQYQALQEGDDSKFDARRLKAEHEEWFPDMEDIEEVYQQNETDVENEEKNKGKRLTVAEKKAKVRERNKKVEETYDADFAPGGSGQTLAQANEENLSDVELDRVQATAEQDYAAMDAARFHEAAQDENDAAMADILRQQQQRAREEVAHDPEAQGWDPATKEKKIKSLAAQNMRQMKAVFNEEYRGYWVWEAIKARHEARPVMGSGMIAAPVSMPLPEEFEQKSAFELAVNLQASAFMVGGAKMLHTLAAGDGQLIDAEKLYFGCKGIATRTNMLEEATKGKSKEEIQVLAHEFVKILEKYHEQVEGDSDLEKMQNYVHGDVSGYEKRNVDYHLEGVDYNLEDIDPKDIEKEGKRDQKRVEEEISIFGDKNLEKRMRRGLAGKWRTLEALDKAVKNQDFQAVALLIPHLEKELENFDDAIGDYQADANEYIEYTRMGIAVSVSLLVIVAVSWLTKFRATPALIRAALVMLRASPKQFVMFASLAGSTANIGAGQALKGDGYGWEEWGIDLATLPLDAAMAGFMAGAGSKLLKGSAMLQKMARSSSTIRRLFAQGLAEAAENIAQDLPAGVARTLLQETTWQSNDPLLIIAGSMIEQMVMSGTLSSVIGSVQGFDYAGTYFRTTDTLSPAHVDDILTQTKKLHANDAMEIVKRAETLTEAQARTLGKTTSLSEEQVEAIWSKVPEQDLVTRLQEVQTLPRNGELLDNALSPIPDGSLSPPAIKQLLSKTVGDLPPSTTIILLRKAKSDPDSIRAIWHRRTKSLSDAETEQLTQALDEALKSRPGYKGPEEGYDNQDQVIDQNYREFFDYATGTTRSNQMDPYEGFPKAPTLEEFAEKIKPGRTYLYAVDMEGNIRIALRASREQSPHMFAFHSHLLVGENSLGAGEISFKITRNGKMEIDEINPNCGHYVPDSVLEDSTSGEFGPKFREHLEVLLETRYGFDVERANWHEWFNDPVPPGSGGGSRDGNSSIPVDEPDAQPAKGDFEQFDDNAKPASAASEEVPTTETSTAEGSQPVEHSSEPASSTSVDEVPTTETNTPESNQPTTHTDEASKDGQGPISRPTPVRNGRSYLRPDSQEIVKVDPSDTFIDPGCLTPPKPDGPAGVTWRLNLMYRTNTGEVRKWGSMFIELDGDGKPLTGTYGPNLDLPGLFTHTAFSFDLYKLKIRGTSKTRRALDLLIEVHRNQYGSEPPDLSATLAKDNLVHFQEEYATQIFYHNQPDEAAKQAAIRNLSYGGHHIAIGYTEFEIANTIDYTLSDFEKVVEDGQQKLRFLQDESRREELKEKGLLVEGLSVPDNVEVIASKSKAHDQPASGKVGGELDAKARQAPTNSTETPPAKASTAEGSQPTAHADETTGSTKPATTSEADSAGQTPLADVTPLHGRESTRSVHDDQSLTHDDLLTAAQQKLNNLIPSPAQRTFWLKRVPDEQQLMYLLTHEKIEDAEQLERLLKRANANQVEDILDESDLDGRQLEQLFENTGMDGDQIEVFISAIDVTVDPGTTSRLLSVSEEWLPGGPGRGILDNTIRFQEGEEISRYRFRSQLNEDGRVFETEATLYDIRNPLCQEMYLYHMLELNAHPSQLQEIQISGNEVNMVDHRDMLHLARLQASQPGANMADLVEQLPVMSQWHEFVEQAGFEIIPGSLEVHPGRPLTLKQLQEDNAGNDALLSDYKQLEWHYRFKAPEDIQMPTIAEVTFRVKPKPEGGPAGPSSGPPTESGNRVNNVTPLRSENGTPPESDAAEGMWVRDGTTDEFVDIGPRDNGLNPEQPLNPEQLGGMAPESPRASTSNGNGGNGNGNPPNKPPSSTSGSHGSKPGTRGGRKGSRGGKTKYEREQEKIAEAKASTAEGSQPTAHADEPTGSTKPATAAGKADMAEHNVHFSQLEGLPYADIQKLLPKMPKDLRIEEALELHGVLSRSSLSPDQVSEIMGKFNFPQNARRADIPPDTFAQQLDGFIERSDEVWKARAEKHPRLTRKLLESGNKTPMRGFGDWWKFVILRARANDLLLYFDSGFELQGMAIINPYQETRSIPIGDGNLTCLNMYQMESLDGASIPLIRGIIRESVNRGYGGAIAWEPAHQSVSYYKMMGAEVSEELNIMYVTPEKAQQFLSSSENSKRNGSSSGTPPAASGAGGSPDIKADSSATGEADAPGQNTYLDQGKGTEQHHLHEDSHDVLSEGRTIEEPVLFAKLQQIEKIPGNSQLLNDILSRVPDGKLSFDTITYLLSKIDGDLQSHTAALLLRKTDMDPDSIIAISGKKGKSTLPNDQDPFNQVLDQELESQPGYTGPEEGFPINAEKSADDIGIRADFEAVKKLRQEGKPLNENEIKRIREETIDPTADPFEGISKAPTLQELIDNKALKPDADHIIQPDTDYIFAIDTDGNIRLRPMKSRAEMDNPQNHSFLVAGENVYGAGTISFKINKDGKIVVDLITPKSGHYIPLPNWPLLEPKRFGPKFKKYLEVLLNAKYGIKTDTAEWSPWFFAQ